MNLQQFAPTTSSVNGFSHNKSRSEKSNFESLSRNKGGAENSSHQRLVYLTTCLIGHQVEVQVIDGSVFSGIFHATNAEDDFGIILKMACLIKSGSSYESFSDYVNKTPSKTLIIPAKDLVQIVAKGVPVTPDWVTNEFDHEKPHEILIDSSISRSKHVELERELEPWIPDDDILECSELDNTFDRHWNRGWDQFETNAALFGVESTFDEELYTTKLNKGPRMRELEKEALRLAKEIEGEDTQDLHLAEERGIHFHNSFDLDEETKYSSVYRGVDDSGYVENEDIWDSENIETFGNVSSDSAMNKSLADLKSWKKGGSKSSSSFLSMVQGHASQTSSSFLDTESRIEDKHSSQQNSGKHMLFVQNQAPQSEDTDSAVMLNTESSEKRLSANATAYAPSSNKPWETISCSESASQLHAAAAASSTSELSPSSSMASLTSEKSTLNPHAKEFKFNPNAKSFIPPTKPASPVPDTKFKFPPPPSHMPAGIGMGSPFGAQQPVIYGQSQQPYFQSNVSQYGQLGQPRQMVYMPSYPPEMAYKGRDF